MAIKVSVPSSNPRIVSTVATGSKRVTSTKVEQLANVDSTTLEGNFDDDSFGEEAILEEVETEGEAASEE